MLKLNGALALELALRDGKPLKRLQELKALEPASEALMGRCLVVLSQEAPGEFLKESSLGGRALLVLQAQEYLRCYWLHGEPSEAGSLLGSLLSLDWLLCQSLRQRRFYQGQMEGLQSSREGFQRHVGQVLFRKGPQALSTLEADVDALAEAYGVCANYGMLLKEAMELLGRHARQLAQMLQALGLPPEEQFFRAHLRETEEFLQGLRAQEEDFDRTAAAIKSALEVLRGRIELARGRQSLALQEESLLLGTAASLVEFFLVLYYGLGVWKALAPEVFSALPPALKAALMVAFSCTVVLSTHKGARALKEHRPRALIPWGLLILAMAALIVAASLLYAP
jgi:hypothetical protein